MQKPTLILVFVALLAIVGGAILVPQMLSEPAAPVVQWGLEDEIEGADPEAEQGDAQAQSGTIERTQVEPIEGAVVPADAGQRVAAILRGRVVDKFQQPVAGARVWLEFGRAGGRNPRGRDRNRRIPEPVETDREGRFAFQGQTFRRLRVSLQVQHETHAPGLFDKDLGDIADASGTMMAQTAEVELGDLVLKNGGQVRGRVVDLAGNGVPNASLSLEPDFRNRMRWQRNSQDLLPAIVTDTSGFYTYTNIAEGDYVVAAVAKMHTEGRSDGFTVTEEQIAEVADIQLGPGFELSGYVRDTQGQPIANADVVLRAARNDEQGPGRGGRGRGGPRGRNRDSRTKTDDKGMFFAEHLPGATLELRVDAEGFLDYEQTDIDPKVTQVVNVTMDVGLSIKGVVQRPDGSLVKSFAVRAVRVRGLPAPGQPDLTIEQMVARMGDETMSDDQRRQMMEQMRDLRENFRGGRGGGFPGGGRGGGGGGGPSELGEPQMHPDGTFVAEGLQEGFYEVQIQAPDFARYQSEEVAVRLGHATPMLRVVVDAGVYCAGVVLDRFGDPIAGAEVELRAERPPTEDTTPQPGGDRNRGGMDFARMAADWVRRSATQSQRLQTKTDAEGLFFVKHALRGTYRLTASADGFADGRTEVFELQADRSNFELRLEPLGSIVGTVSGVGEAELREARVGAVALPEGDGMPNMFGGRGGRGGRGFRTVEVNPDGSYRIDDLTPGQYVVRSWIGSPQQLMRELGPQFFEGGLQPDAVVRGGEEARLDLQLSRPQVGIVTGSVMHNGVSANGFRVELRRQDESGQAPVDGPGGGRNPMARMRNFGRTFTGTVGADGTFEIKDVTAGLYTLQVRSARRGGILHEEVVQVTADAVSERSFVLQSASLQGTLLCDDGSDPSQLRGMVGLLRDQTEAPENLMSVMRESGNMMARINGGKFEFETVKPGSYLLIVRPQNRQQTTQIVSVVGEDRVDVHVGPANATAPEGTGR